MQAVFLLPKRKDVSGFPLLKACKDKGKCLVFVSRKIQISKVATTGNIKRKGKINAIP